VYRRLERWRSKRRGRARISEVLWAAAGAGAGTRSQCGMTGASAGVQSAQAQGRIGWTETGEIRNGEAGVCGTDRARGEDTAELCPPDGRERAGQAAD
jgi:hypothetical protein